MSQGGSIGSAGTPATGSPTATATPATTNATAAPAATPTAPAATPVANAPLANTADQSVPPWARPYAQQQAMLQQAQPVLQSYANQSGVSDSWNRQQEFNSLDNNFRQSGAMGAQGGKGGMPGAQGSSVNSTTSNDIMSSRQTPINLSEILKQFNQQQAMGQGLGSTPQATQATSSINSLQ